MQERCKVTFLGPSENHEVPMFKCKVKTRCVDTSRTKELPAPSVQPVVVLMTEE
jgi:hypothetical protein